ncbi:MAG: RNA recognition motif domain-containing protein [Anaerolineae bacterium]|jgi:RNA recognition motif-containing protein
MAKKLYVGNLDYTVTEQDLETLFSEHGEILSTTVVKDRYSGRSKGFGFVEFANNEDAQKAKQALNGQDLKGRALRVDDAREQRRDRGPRDYGRRSRY